jgi:MoaA/NifB/PqqE/SkfB family radical SAM enzyme
MYNPNLLQVFLDISTFCNAACPKCHRTNPNGLDKADWLPLVQWDLDTFKKAYDLNKPRIQYGSFHFCGTWGDPVMNKDLTKMVEYILKNSRAYVTIDTNGSIRDEEWWWNLGILGGKRLRVTFAVDGLDQEMHAFYRRNTSLSKVLDNMEALSNTMASIYTRTIVFKHNEDYLDQIHEMVKDHGAVRSWFTPSDRWYKDSGGPFVFNFTDADGKEQKFEKSKIVNEYQM